jgi:hypothetical protein
MDSPVQIFWGILFGTVGMAYFVYGKKQQMFMPMICGLGLMVYPYFVANTILLVLIGAAISVLPYFIRL